MRYDEIWINNLHTNSRPNIYQCNNIQLLHLNEINVRFYGAEYNNIERGFNIVVFGFASFNIVVLCSINPHIDQVQV